jgi:uncharacterized SAM-binding protein YcdF (DUF218 family)
MLMLLRLKILVKSLLLPPAGPLLTATIGIFLLKRRPLLARSLLIAGLGSLWLLSVPVVSDVLARWVGNYPPLDWNDARGAQAIVVLGGGGQRAFAPEYGGPSAEPLLLERLSYGAYVSHRTSLPILVTGFHIEAEAMRDTLQRNFNIDARWVDDQAYDTFENARNSVRLLAADGVSRIVLVTHATHMRRSVHEFMAAGMQVVPAPVGVLAVRETGPSRYLPSYQGLLQSSFAINELIGEPVRALLSATHLRAHGADRTGGADGHGGVNGATGPR